MADTVYDYGAVVESQSTTREVYDYGAVVESQASQRIVYDYGLIVETTRILTRQQAAGSPTALGANFVLTTPPTNTGAQPPTTDTSAGTVVQWETPPVFGASGAGHSAGDVPDPGASPSTTRFLREDSSWALPVASPAHLGIALTAPPTTGWTWLNQGSATITNASNGLFMTCPSQGAADSLHTYFRAAPATPWTVTALLMPTLTPTNFASVGVAAYDSVSGRLSVIRGPAGTALAALFASQFTSATAFSSNPASLNLNSMSPIWLRLNDDGTNLIMLYSLDGVNWFTLHSEGRTSWLTNGANKVGFFVDAYSTATSVTVLSWTGA